MASLESRPRGGYRIVFRFEGKKYSRTLKTKCEQTANLALARLEVNLHRLRRGKLKIPDGADLVSALLSDSARRAKRRRVARSMRRRIRTERNGTSPVLGKFLEMYLESIQKDSIEEGTRRMIEIHFRHLRRVVGESTPVASVTKDVVQKYVDARSHETGRRGKTVSTATIRKEVTTWSTAWNWGLASNLITSPLPKAQLQYPKGQQKPPFQTMAQIERRMARGGLSEIEREELWDSLFLTVPEIDQLLQHVRKSARHGFVYPLFSFAAHTGARRSEMLRSEIDDLDFQTMAIILREKKRVKGHDSTRTVPMTEFLADVMRTWMHNHPGGRFTFCLPTLSGANTRPCKLSPNQAVDYFKRTLAKSPWSVIRGYHVFRHSFCSNAAARGIDQRMINAWVGHQTEEMVRRYRHLLPNRDAIQAVFG